VLHHRGGALRAAGQQACAERIQTLPALFGQELKLFGDIKVVIVLGRSLSMRF